MSSDKLNPYAAPATTDPEHIDSRQTALARLRGPSLGLLVLGVTWGGIGAVACSATLAIVLWLFVTKPDQAAWVIRSTGARDTFLILSMLPSLFVAFGAWCMRRGVRYGWAVGAAVLASIPFFGPCIWLGMPLGIWSLVILRRPDVRSAFLS